MVRQWLGLSLMTLATVTALGDNPVCVRDYKTREGQYACDRFAKAYTWVFPESRAVAKVCARRYQSSFCQKSPGQYVEIPATDGSIVCVLNFNQSPSNLCESIPANYQYVLNKVP